MIYFEQGSHGKDVEAILRNLQAQMARKSEELRLMRESLGAQQAALVVKQRELEMLMRERDLLLASKEAEEMLVTDFLEADANNNYEDQNAMMDTIVALINLTAGIGGPDGVNGDDD